MHKCRKVIWLTLHQTYKPYADSQQFFRSFREAVTREYINMRLWCEKMTYKINARYLKRICRFLLGKTVSKPKTCNVIHLYFDSNLAIYNAK